MKSYFVMSVSPFSIQKQHTITYSYRRYNILLYSLNILNIFSDLLKQQEFFSSNYSLF